VILLCNGNRWIRKRVFGLDRFNPLCRPYVFLRWFFRLVSGVGQGEGVLLMGHCCLSVVSV